MPYFPIVWNTLPGVQEDISDFENNIVWQQQPSSAWNPFFTQDELELAREFSNRWGSKQEFVSDVLPKYRSQLANMQKTNIQNATQKEAEVEEDLSGLDIWVKWWQAVSDFAKQFKFESNVDDWVVKSFGKFLWNLPANTVQLAWDIVSVVSDPVWTATSIKELAWTTVEQGLNKTFSTDAWQDILRKLGASEDRLAQIKWEWYFTTDERAILKDAIQTELTRITDEPGRLKELLVENPTDVLLTVTWGLWVAKNVAKSKNLTGLANKLETLEKITNPITIQKQVWGLWVDLVKWGWRLVKDVWEFGTSKLSWLSIDTIKTIVKDPKTFGIAEKWWITTEWLWANVLNKIDQRVKDLWGTGKQYNKVRADETVFKFDDAPLDWLIDDLDIKIWRNGKLDFSDSAIWNVTDQNSIQKAYALVKSKAWNELNGNSTLNLRQNIDSNINFALGNTWQGKNAIKSIRSIVDDQAKDNIPGLRRLDQKFSKEIWELNDIKKNLYNKDWSLKDNYMTTINNLTNKWNEVKLARIKKVIPDVEKQINALKAFEDVEFSKGTKVWTYAQWAGLGAWVVAWITTWNPLVWLATLMVLNPTVISKVLQGFWYSKQFIKTVWDKVKKWLKLNKEESTLVSQAVQEQIREWAWDVKWIVWSQAKNDVKSFVNTISTQIDDLWVNKEALLSFQDELADLKDTLPKVELSILQRKLTKALDEIEELKKTDIWKFALTDQFPEDLVKSFNFLKWIQKRLKKTKSWDKFTSVEFQKTPAFKKFSESAQEYLKEIGDDTTTVQELFERLDDF